jgi:hemolysin activation/secretion protein
MSSKRVLGALWISAAIVCQSAQAEVVRIKLDDHREIEISDISVPDVATKIRSFHWHFIKGQTPSVYAEAVQEIYRQDGYPLASVRFTHMKDKNIAIIHVDEGEIGSVKVTGLSEKNEALARGHLSHVMHRKPVRTVDLERAIALINDMAGVTATSHLVFPNPDRNVAEIVVSAKETGRQGAATIDNIPRELGRQTRFGVIQHFNSAFSAGDQIKLSGSLISGADITPKFVGGADYRVPINTYGTYGQARINMTRIPGSADYDGLVTAAVVGHPIIRNLHEYMYVIGHIEHITESVTPSGYKNNQINVGRVTGIYNISSDFGSATKLRLTFTAGGTDNYYNAHDPNYVLPANFTHFRGAVGHIHQLDGLMSGAQFRFEAYGQISNGRLPDSESFYLGGEQYMRGYSYATIRGDTGYAGTAEIGKTFFFGQEWFRNVTAYAFFDHGHVSNKQDVSTGSTRSRPGGRSLNSTGIGARAQLAGNVGLSAFVGVPLNRDASSGKLGPAAYVSLSKGW